MINELIEKYKRLVEENYDLDNCFADLSKGIVYQEIIQDLKKVKESKLNRNFIGIELDETYFNIAKERIEEIIEKYKEK